MRGLAIALVALALLAGCVSTGVTPASTLVGAMATGAASAFSFDAKDCVAGGFASSYPGPQKLADIWDTADIREELGNPVHDATGLPVTGPLTGNWHVGVKCKSADGPGGTTKDFQFGWVGQMVEPPAWDTGGADVHFLLTGLAFDEGPIGNALRNATTADITHVDEVSFDWKLPQDLPRSAVYARFVDRERGVYESWSDMQHYRDVKPRVIRFWWQVPADGSMAESGHHHTSGMMEGKFHPLSFDMVVGGGPQMTTPPDGGVELGSHNMLKMEHGPVLAQPCVTLFYQQPTVSFTLGKVRDDITLDAVWTH